MNSNSMLSLGVFVRSRFMFVRSELEFVRSPVLFVRSEPKFVRSPVLFVRSRYFCAFRTLAVPTTNS